MNNKLNLIVLGCILILSAISAFILLKQPVKSHSIQDPPLANLDCFDPISIPFSGRHQYATVEDTQKCPEPPEEAKVQAVLNARNNILAGFGVKWCNKGNEKCFSTFPQCIPSLKDMRISFFPIEDKPTQNDSSKKDCYVVAIGDVTVLCRCKE